MVGSKETNLTIRDDLRVTDELIVGGDITRPAYYYQSGTTLDTGYTQATANMVIPSDGVIVLSAKYGGVYVHLPAPTVGQKVTMIYHASMSATTNEVGQGQVSGNFWCNTATNSPLQKTMLTFRTPGQCAEFIGGPDNKWYLLGPASGSLEFS